MTWDLATRRLAGYCLYGAFGLSGCFYAAARYYKYQFANSEYHKKAMDIVNKYPPALKELGKPILPRSVNLGESFNKVDGINAQIVIPVAGNNGSGKLFLWASREKPGDSWEIDALDILILRTKQQWTFYRKEDQNNHKMRETNEE